MHSASNRTYVPISHPSSVACGRARDGPSGVLDATGPSPVGVPARDENVIMRQAFDMNSRTGGMWWGTTIEAPDPRRRLPARTVLRALRPRRPSLLPVL